jgi:hypothetical protein
VGLSVLLVRGGVYVDPQLECLGPIEPLFGSFDERGVFLARHESEERCSCSDFALLAGQSGATIFGRLLADLLSSVSIGPNVGFPPGSIALIRKIMTDKKPDESSVIFIDPAIGQRIWKRISSVTRWVQASQGKSPVLDGKSRLELGHTPTTSYRWARFLFLGHPRCGSRSLAAMLAAAGLSIGHERLMHDGAVTWWQTGRRIRHAAWPAFASGGQQHREVWLAGSVFHYIRDPRQAIPSIILENEANGRENNSFRFRRVKLKQKYGIDIGQMGTIEAAASSYALWNKTAEDLATAGRVLVERPELMIDHLCLKLDPATRLNSSERKFGKSKPDVDFKEVITCTSREVRVLLERYADLYDTGAIA